AADEARQAHADRHRPAVGGEQAYGEVERLVDDHVVGGAHEVRLHFLGHGEHAVAHDLSEDRVCLGLAALHRFLPTSITRLPKLSTCMRSPGSSTVVEACSSTSAGPAMRL